MIDKIEFTAKNLFSFKTTQMARDINFRTFKKLPKKKKIRKIVIDLDSRAVNIEGN